MTPPGRPEARTVALAAVLVAATVYLGVALNEHYRVAHWLFWRYAQAWLLVGLWAVACVTAGHEALTRLRVASGLRLGERVVFSFALGALSFGLSIFALGLVGGLSRPLFFLLPTALIAAGFRSARAFGQRAFRHLAAARRRAPPSPWWVAPLLFTGAIAFGLLYIQVLSPDSMHFDARWYHMPLAEHYATSGSIRATPEGWYLSGVPQLVSYLYTWAFLHPSPLLFDRVELALHMEVVCFLFTMAMVQVAVRRLVPGARARMTWLGIFLFPGVFLYDSNLSGAADHVGAIWIIPMGLSLARALTTFDRRWCVLLAAFVSALAITKYSMFSVLAVPILAIPLGSIYQLVRRRLPARDVLIGVGLITAVGVALTSTHWLKNLIFYRDPFYPVLNARIRPPFWTQDATGMLALYNGMTWPAPAGIEGWKETLKVVFNFAFKPNDWPYFHGQVPVFGFLFTLTTFCLPFVRGARRLWPVYLGCMLTVFCWYRVHHQDRYLQVAVPWMAAGTLGVMLLVWRTHWVARLALVPLVALQVIWSGDIPFIGTHNQIGNDSPIRAAAKYLESGFKKMPGRLRIHAPWDDIGASLPAHSKVLVHESPIHLGLRSPSINDQWQGGLSYRELGSPGAAYDWLKKNGATHLLWEYERSHGYDTIGSDLVFSELAVRFGLDRKRHSYLAVARLPDQRPPDAEFRDAVAVFSCGGPFATGLYHVRDLAWPGAGARPKPYAALSSKPYDSALLTKQAGYIVFNAACHPAIPTEVEQVFPDHVWRDKDKLMLRAPPLR